MARQSFGSVEKRGSTWRAYYMHQRVRYLSPKAFSRKEAAHLWLAKERVLLDGEDWTPPADRVAAMEAVPTVVEYARKYIGRRAHLKAWTLFGYERTLSKHLAPTRLGGLKLNRVKVADVLAWHDALTCGTRTRQQAYAFVKAVFEEARRDDVVRDNPCRIRGASASRSTRKPRIPTPEELRVLVDALPEKYRLLVLLAAFGAMRHEEVAGLQVVDLHLDGDAPHLHIARAVTWPGNVQNIGDPKTPESQRDVPLPVWLVPVIRQHIATFVPPDAADGWLFTGGKGLIAATSWQGVWKRARAKAGLSTMTFHDLRKTGATWAAKSGVPLADLQKFTGHADLKMLVHYMQANSDSGRRIAEAMPALPSSAPVYT